MGVWSRSEGRIDVNSLKEKHFSVEKAVAKIFEGEEFFFKFDNHTGDFFLNVEKEGDDADFLYKNLITVLGVYNVKYTLDTTIAWRSR